MLVEGNIYHNTKIDWDGNIQCDGYLFDSVEVRSNDGNIKTEDVDQYVTLSTYNGKVSAKTVGPNAIVKAYSGSVHVASHDPSATVKVHSGTCNVGRINSNSRRSGSTANVINNNVMSFFSHSSSEDTARRFDSSVPNQQHTSRDTNNDNNNISEALRLYIASYDDQTESYPDVFKRLNIDYDDVESGLCCKISHDIPRIPVSLNDNLYDWHVLKNISKNSNNEYIDPMNRMVFTFKKIKPSRIVRDIIEGKIKEAEEKEVDYPSTSFRR